MNRPRPAETDVTAVYLETGSKRVFASAVEWPGWTRAGRDEGGALEALIAYAPRYAKVVTRSRLGFRAPRSVEDLTVVGRVPGNATTDFGAPDAAAPSDADPIDAAELKRLVTILRASWRALDAAAASARGRRLATGPRGGGRPLTAILEHVTGAEQGYLARLAWRAPGTDPQAVRTSVVEALVSAVEHGVEERGPRGGKRWLPRYFVRRVAWHALDHAWEIQDRAG
jgi:hypothetical protein